MYRHIIDPGHSWLEVPLRDLNRVGFVPSTYSYYDPTYAMTYLEEDCDMPGYIEAVVGTDREAVREFYATQMEVRHVDDFKRRFKGRVSRPVPGAKDPIL